MEQHRAECLAVGRDLVRALHEAARVPEIEALWTSLFQQEGPRRAWHRWPGGLLAEWAWRALPLALLPRRDLA
eukprot:scaffold539_cov359-Prasinococcus_capsulatus_cf.AAC.8